MLVQKIQIYNSLSLNVIVQQYYHTCVKIIFWSKTAYGWSRENLLFWIDQVMIFICFHHLKI